MENMKLSDQEQRWYSELFSSCEPDRDQRVTGANATELFLSSGLPAETLFQIANMCGAKRLGYFGRSQFYIALKLIAVAQAGLPVAVESFSCSDIPLPKFIRQNDQGEDSMQLNQHSDNQDGDIERRRLASQMQACSVLNQPDYQERLGLTQQQSVVNQAGPGALPPPPSKHTRSFSGPRPPGIVTVAVASQDGQLSNSRTSPPVNNSSPPRFSPRNSPPGSPQRRRIVYNKQASTPAAPTQVRPTCSSKLEKAWASFEDEDNRGLITNDRKEWNELSNEHARNLPDTISINSSEADSLDDMWTINDEQREYYVRQFEAMQRDLNGMIPGSVAKDFFEKSKLPVHELSKVWQLSDVNRDGALSLEEFCTAMHLVVLRRNEIELPDKLPPSLMPYTPLVNSEEPFAADLPPGGTLKRLSPQSPDPQHWMMTSSMDSPSNSGLSSPGMVKSDLSGQNDYESRVHPARDEVDSPDDFRSRALSDPGLDNEIQSPTRQRSMTDAQHDHTDPRDKYSAPLHGRPRPTPKKAHSGSFSLPSQGQLAPPPPTVPPRPSPGDALKTCSSKSPGSDDELGVREQSSELTLLQSTIRDQRMRNEGLARLNTELNEELQEVMEQRIALEIQLEHLRPFSS